MAWTQQFHFMWQINGSSTAAEVTQSTYKDKAIVLLWGSWKAKHFGRCSLWLFVSFVKTSHKSCGYITITVIRHHLHLFALIFLLQLSKQVDVLWSRGQSESFFSPKGHNEHVKQLWMQTNCSIRSLKLTRKKQEWERLRDKLTQNMQQFFLVAFFLSKIYIIYLQRSNSLLCLSLYHYLIFSFSPPPLPSFLLFLLFWLLLPARWGKT